MYFAKSIIKKPLLVAADIYRPAAIQQLETLGKQLSIACIFTWGQIFLLLKLSDKRLRNAKEEHHDVVIIDTAGRSAC